MIKPAYSVSFLLSVNIFVWQNVLYLLDAPRRMSREVHTILIEICRCFTQPPPGQCQDSTDNSFLSTFSAVRCTLTTLCILTVPFALLSASSDNSYMKM